jgi:hypothetical protein
MKYLLLILRLNRDILVGSDRFTVMDYVQCVGHSFIVLSSTGLRVVKKTEILPKNSMGAPNSGMGFLFAAGLLNSANRQISTACLLSKRFGGLLIDDITFGKCGSLR